jgi:hypothetical protein
VLEHKWFSQQTDPLQQTDEIVYIPRNWTPLFGVLAGAALIALFFVMVLTTRGTTP